MLTFGHREQKKDDSKINRRLSTKEETQVQTDRKKKKGTNYEEKSLLVMDSNAKH